MFFVNYFTKIDETGGNVKSIAAFSYIKTIIKEECSMEKARRMKTNREEMDNREMNGGSEVGGKQQYLAIERETLLYAGIDPDDDLMVVPIDNTIIIRQKDVYDRILEKLPKLFDEIGVPPETAAAVLLEIAELLGRSETVF